jgi:hypothetical protein
MKYFVHFFLVLFLFTSNKITSQVNNPDSTNKITYLISSSDGTISETNFSLYNSALQNFSTLDELRFLNQRRTILFEKDMITVELFSANELLDKYGKEISPLTIIPGSKFLPVEFQLINWENAYAVHPIFDKSNELTH